MSVDRTPPKTRTFEQFTISMRMPSYSELWISKGGLLPDGDRAAIACWHYYLCALMNYKRQVNYIQLEGEPDQEYNFRQLFLSIATAYGTSPEHMSNHFVTCDLQARQAGIEELPHKRPYRQNLRHN